MSFPAKCAPVAGSKIARFVRKVMDWARTADVDNADLIALHADEPMTDGSGSRPSVVVPCWIAAAENGILIDVEMPQSADARIRCAEILKHAGDCVGQPLQNVDRIG